MSQHDTLTLREALRSIQYEAASLADAQVIALQALNATYPARAALSATQPAQAAQSDWGAQQFKAPVYPPDGTESPFTVINLGSGKVQMGDSVHDGRLPALWFGINGQGMGHEEVMNREAHPGETLAVVTFANVEGLDVLLDVIQRIRREKFPEAKAAQGGGEVVAWLHQCRKKPELKALSFSKEKPGLSSMGYKPRPLTYADTQPAAGADVLDAASPVGDWSYSHDEERFSGQFSTREEAIEEAVSCGARFIGRVRHARDFISDEMIGGDIRERISEILGDEVGEVAECFSMTSDQERELGKVVLDWIEAGPGFNCWGIKDVEPIDAAIAASGRQE